MSGWITEFYVLIQEFIFWFKYFSIISYFCSRHTINRSVETDSWDIFYVVSSTFYSNLNDGGHVRKKVYCPLDWNWTIKLFLYTIYFSFHILNQIYSTFISLVTSILITNASNKKYKCYSSLVATLLTRNALSSVWNLK